MYVIVTYLISVRARYPDAGVNASTAVYLPLVQEGGSASLRHGYWRAGAVR